MENLRSSIEIPFSFNSYTMQWFQQLHNAMVSTVTQCNGFNNYTMQWFPLLHNAMVSIITECNGFHSYAMQWFQQLHNAMVSIVRQCKNLGVHLTFSLTSHESYTPLFYNTFCTRCIISRFHLSYHAMELQHYRLLYLPQVKLFLLSFSFLSPCLFLSSSLFW